MSPTPPATTTHEFHCLMAPEPAALERLCQTLRVRGFRIQGFHASLAPDGLRIQCRVSGNRPPAMLHNQLARLHSVKSVSWSSLVDTPAEVGDLARA